MAPLQVLCLERRGAGYVSVEEICCLQAQLPSLRQLAFGWGSEIPEMQVSGAAKKAVCIFSSERRCWLVLCHDIL